jgi:hypothetical protein
MVIVVMKVLRLLRDSQFLPSARLTYNFNIGESYIRHFSTLSVRPSDTLVRLVRRDCRDFGYGWDALGHFMASLHRP